MRNLGALDELERERLIIKGKREDGAGRRPCADHEMVNPHFRGEFWLLTKFTVRASRQL